MSRLPRLATWSMLLAVLSVASAALFAEEPKGDLKKLRGDWVSKDDQGESTWTFKDDKLTLKAPGRDYEVKIKLDEGAKPEKAIDFDVLETSPNAKGYKAAGIYKFDGDDKLTICFASADAGRPESYEADFMNTFAFVLTRKK